MGMILPGLPKLQDNYKVWYLAITFFGNYGLNNWHTLRCSFVRRSMFDSDTEYTERPSAVSTSGANKIIAKKITLYYQS